MSLSVQAGLSVGGWFVFAKSDVWSYRCNEFVNHLAGESAQHQVKDLIAKLECQANALRKAVSHSVNSGIVTTASLERVDAIWRVL
jgi:hypothetical protein